MNWDIAGWMTPKTLEVLRALLLGWLASLAVAASLKLLLRRMKLNAMLAPRLPKGPDGESSIDLEDRIADGVYWLALSCAVLLALRPLWR